VKFSCLFPPVKSVKFPTRITGQLRDYVPDTSNRYAEPEAMPLSSSPRAPTTTVEPSMATLELNQSLAAPSDAVSLASCVPSGGVGGEGGGGGGCRGGGYRVFTTMSSK